MIWAVKGLYSSEAELYRDARVTERVMLKATLDLFDYLRELHGAPIAINSGRRSEAKQKELIAEGYRAASVSPHVYGAALDVDVPDGKRDVYLVALILGAAKLMGLPQPRIGYKQYRKGATSSFVHYDFAFLLPEGTLEKVPPSWREGVMW